jgi:aerobic-type carbon monoxide dehydrogenase small subunit (CoxS/CutS family)
MAIRYFSAITHLGVGVGLKYGCGIAQCGASLVHIDGVALALAVWL